MKKQTVLKIISSTIIFTFAIFFIQAVLPLQVFASAPLDYSNPNKNGDNPYKFKTGDVLNSQMIMQVVGCTGVVDKISSKITDFAKDTVVAFLQKELKAAAKVVVLKVAKVLGITAVASVINTNLTDVVKEVPTGEIQNVKDATLIEDQKKIKENLDATKKREECFNGIAVTLARNQLTSMTRNTMNWINTGFNGDPMYVQNITSFTNSLEKNVLETGINILTTPKKAYPYGSDFSRSAILGYNSGASFRTGATNFLDSLTSDLGNFITDPKSYYSDNALERANSTNDAFANDFSTGGWDGWLALTQRDQNNPLGFTMKASEFLQDQQINRTENNKAELATNGGFLSQKECVLWDLYWPEGTTEATEGAHITGTPVYDADGITILTSDDPDPKNKYNKCNQNGWKTTTPGSLIKDKVSSYVNSPERQLELTKTINDSLNSLFASLISKFTSEGLSSLSSTDNNFVSTDSLGGYGNNDLSGNDKIDLAGLGLDNPTGSNSSGYTDGSFNLTRDLGNTFIHNYMKASIDATWNAKDNALVSSISQISGQELKMGVAPLKPNGEPVPANVYYVVSTAGHTEIVKDGANNWVVGDRAFWNGSEWQNWKCGPVVQGKCTKQTDPIKKRGVLQIQKDYIVAAKQLLTTLPSIMPKMGELDYCIPGPNPNWRTSAAEAEAAFTKLVGATAKRQTSKYVCPDDKYIGEKPFRLKTEWFVAIPGTHNCLWFTAASFGPIGEKAMRLVPDDVYYAFPPEGTEEYDNYYNIFKDTLDTWWDSVKASAFWNKLNRIDESQGNEGDQKVIDASVKEVSDKIKEFYSVFGSYIDSIYGKGTNGMQREFTENELTGALTPNPNFLPMASEGLDVTKDIVSYNDDITKTTAEYEDSIIKANANINKLEEIKTKVSDIIRAAQKRREANLELRDTELEEKYGFTYAEYKSKHPECINEENISVFEDLSLSKDISKERCNDNMDNDLDGLIDNQDPDCHETGALCTDGIDNDNDGYTDGYDADCGGTQYHLGEIIF